ncbi:MAG: hypothetical protein O4808_10305, partial [Trichodesmium sp. St17_bin3_1_1]|nr:hypothetical protein [Trichodesmium sp. St17_bin3_1_1]
RTEIIISIHILHCINLIDDPQTQLPAYLLSNLTLTLLYIFYEKVEKLHNKQSKASQRKTETHSFHR